MSNIALLVAATASPSTRDEQRYRHLQAIKQQRRPERVDATPIAVRKLGEPDRSALARLAAVDSSAVPAGELLGAEVDGTLVAAISLSDGSIVADPFQRSTSAIELLRLRAGQLAQATDGRRRRRLPRLRRRLAVRRGDGRGTIGSSPPGGGGKLLRL